MASAERPWVSVLTRQPGRVGPGSGVATLIVVSEPRLDIYGKRPYTIL